MNDGLGREIELNTMSPGHRDDRYEPGNWTIRRLTCRKSCRNEKIASEGGQGNKSRKD